MSRRLRGSGEEKRETKKADFFKRKIRYAFALKLGHRIRYGCVVDSIEHAQSGASITTTPRYPARLPPMTSSSRFLSAGLLELFFRRTPEKVLTAGDAKFQIIF
jgi:hypothetical protein